jgi:hypothetical protein
MQKDNPRRKGKAGVPKFEDHILPVRKKKRLKRYHLPKQMGFYLFFMPDNIQVFVWGDAGGICGNDNRDFTG